MQRDSCPRPCRFPTRSRHPIDATPDESRLSPERRRLNAREYTSMDRLSNSDPGQTRDSEYRSTENVNELRALCRVRLGDRAPHRALSSGKPYHFQIVGESLGRRRTYPAAERKLTRRRGGDVSRSTASRPPTRPFDPVRRRPRRCPRRGSCLLHPVPAGGRGPRRRFDSRRQGSRAP